MGSWRIPGGSEKEKKMEGSNTKNPKIENEFDGNTKALYDLNMHRERRTLSTGCTMPTQKPTHFKAVLQALLVTFLWSTSQILVKFGLTDIPALTFAGLRYSLAFLVLLPFAIRAGAFRELKGQPRQQWMRLAGLGLVYYAVTQGAIYVSLSYLPVVTLGLAMSFTSILVALLGIAFLKERPTPLQWAGTLLYLAGVVIYFYPAVLPAGTRLGLIAAGVGLIANTASSLMGRSVNREGSFSPLTITVVGMGVGGVLLLGSQLALQGFPPMTLTQWAIVAWLAVVNSAFAFTLWNHTLRTLTAMESSVLNNTMIFQVALLAWVFLAEVLTPRQIAGILLAGVGALVVQLRRASQ